MSDLLNCASLANHNRKDHFTLWSGRANALFVGYEIDTESLELFKSVNLRLGGTGGPIIAPEDNHIKPA